jgi:protein O-mannosyl-transferase
MTKKNKFRPQFIWLMFLLIALVVFSKLFGNFFVSDDWHWLWLADNQTWTWHIFASNYAGENLGGSYNPLLLVLFKIAWPIFGLKYIWYHVVSVVVHATNAYLVYLLARQIFSFIKIKLFDKAAWLAGVLFLLWPVQVEAVAWVSAWPHLWVTLFSLLSLLNYLKSRLNNSQKHFILSLLFFIIALLIKETAIVLPFIILLWEVWLMSDKKFKIKKKFQYVWAYLAALVIFSVLRYIVTGLFFGYYGSKNIQISPIEWINNAAGLINETITFSFARNIFFKLSYFHLETIAVLSMTAMALYFYYLLRSKKTFHFIILTSWFFMLVPFTFVLLHRTTFGGERYLYLPMIFFVIWFAYIFYEIKVSKSAKTVMIVLMLLFCLALINFKINIWQHSGALSKQIIDSYPKLNQSPGQKLYSVGLPDNLSGAEVFRNNLQQALELSYPHNYPEITPLLAYVHVNPYNKNHHLLSWRQDDMGWFAESVSGQFVVTGITSIEIANMYYELWHYNYQNYTANLIRLIPKGDLAKQVKNKTAKLLTFDQGVLKIID